LFSNRGNIRRPINYSFWFSYVVVKLIMQVIPMGFVFEDDTLVEPDSLTEPQSRNPLDKSLLDVDQLLESVCIIS
jgi:hypothetical protein